MNYSNVLGGVISKRTDTGIQITTSNLTDKMLNIERNIPELNTVDDVISQIEYVTMKTHFSSKYAGVDEFTGKYYKEHDFFNEDDDDNFQLKSMLIPGCNTFVTFPRGSVLYHSDNQILFDFACIQYYIDNCAIPISLTNLDDTILYRINRSDGTQHNSIIKGNYSLRISKTRGKPIIEQHFMNDKTDPLSNNKTTNVYKAVMIDEFFETNNIKLFTIKLPYINIENYTKTILSLELTEKLINFYNNHIDLHLKIYEEYLEKYGLVTIENDMLTLNL